MTQREEGRQKHMVNSVADRNTEMTQRVLRMARQTETQYHLALASKESLTTALSSLKMGVGFLPWAT